MTPQKGEYSPELIDENGRSREDRVDDAERKNDQALGHLVTSTIRTIFKGPQGLLIAVLMAWLGLSPLTTFWHAKPTTTLDLLPIVKRIESDVVEIKITNKAVLNTLPAQARKEALMSIQLQLAAVAMAKNKDAQ